MTLSEYLIEAVAKRATGKYFDSYMTKEQLVEWLEQNGFKQLDHPGYSDEKSYDVANTHWGNWVDVHSKEIFSLVFLFDSKNKINQVVISKKRTRSSIKISNEQAIEILKTMALEK